MKYKILSGLVMVLVLGLAFPLTTLASDSGPEPATKMAETKAETKGETAPASQPAPVPPSDVKEAVEKGKEMISAAKEGRWWYFSSVACLIVMFILSKIPGLFTKLGRWKYALLPALAAASGLLAAFAGGVSLENALGVFTSSWMMGMVEEAWNHGVLGKPHKSPSS